jgi:hypothetical protein
MDPQYDATGEWTGRNGHLKKVTHSHPAMAPLLIMIIVFECSDLTIYQHLSTQR